MRAFAFGILVVAGCTWGGRLEPIHASVVCSSGGVETCPPAERVAAFDRWAQTAMRRPGSTFSVQVVRPGTPPRLEFTACVPYGWGSGVMEAKATFLQEGRRRAGKGGPAVPPGCVPTRDLAGSVVVLGPQGRLALDGGGQARHVAVVCDQSDSMLGAACDTAALDAAYDGWLERSGAAVGSSFAIYGVGASRDGAERLFEVVAGRLPSGDRVARLVSARDRLAAGLDGAPTGSAIAEALSVAAAGLREQEGARELLVLSDLRQVSPGTWNFEVSAPTPAAFDAWLRSKGLAVDLRGVEVRGCGLHHRRAPGARPYDAPLARRVEAVWKRSFEAMGAPDARLGGGCSGAVDGAPGRELAAR